VGFRAHSKQVLAAVALACAGMSASAGVVINLLDIGGVTGSPAEQGFKIAAKYWESVLTNDAVINFKVGFSSLPPNVLGGTSSTLTVTGISNYHDMLAANGSKSTLDDQALAGFAPLDANGSVKVTVPSYLDGASFDGVATTGTRLAPTNTAISSGVVLSSANLKALQGGNDQLVDATIQFSSDFAFDFDPSNGITAGQSDFIGVAIHEMGHALGFLSGADDFDYYAGNGGFKPDAYVWGNALDMFRYSAPGQLDWSFGANSYFSLDGGATAYDNGYFSTGEVNGDGWQASHWKAPVASPFCSGFEGVMNPYICGGREGVVTGLDLAAMDAIGWNVAVDVSGNSGYSINTAQIYQEFAPAAVPEPMSLVLALSALGLMGGVSRRRADRAS
jgi:hypothetical protein